jgi:hypothetical protein
MGFFISAFFAFFKAMPPNLGPAKTSQKGILFYCFLLFFEFIFPRGITYFFCVNDVVFLFFFFAIFLFFFTVFLLAKDAFTSANWIEVF